MPRSRALGCVIWRVWVAAAGRSPAEPASTRRQLSSRQCLTDATSIGDTLPERPRVTSSRPGTDDLVASIIRLVRPWPGRTQAARARVARDHLEKTASPPLPEHASVEAAGQDATRFVADPRATQVCAPSRTTGRNDAMPMPHRTFAQVAKRRLVGKEGSERVKRSARSWRSCPTTGTAKCRLRTRKSALTRTSDCRRLKEPGWHPAPLVSSFPWLPRSTVCHGDRQVPG